MRNKLLGYYNYTVILTYIGMLTGFLGIVRTIEGDIKAGLICLMVAGVCDMFDGAIASTRKRTDDEKCFGIQIDSFSDLICFGVLPAMVLVCLNRGNDVAYGVSAVYVLCALIRLSYYNVDEQNRQKSEEGGRKYFYGLPVTNISLIMPLLFAVCHIFNAKKATGLAATITLFIVGVLFLSPVRIKKAEIIGKIAVGMFGLIEFIFLLVGLGDV